MARTEAPTPALPASTTTTSTPAATRATSTEVTSTTVSTATAASDRTTATTGASPETQTPSTTSAGSTIATVAAFGGPDPLTNDAWAATPADPGYTFMYPDGSGGPSAWWSPCAPIRYSVNLADAPAGALDETLAAVAMVSQASGLSFEFMGTTASVPDPAGAGGQLPKGTDAVIAWVNPATLGWPRGEAGDGGNWWQAAGSRHRIGQGYVLLNGKLARTLLRPGFGPGYSQGHVLLHELGHMLGLGHTGDPTQVMYADQGPLSPGTYGPGDLTGLRALGSEPCM